MHKWKLTLKNEKGEIVDSYESIIDSKLSPKEVAQLMVREEEQYYKEQYDGYHWDWAEAESHEFKARIEKVGTFEIYDFDAEINVWVEVEAESIIDDFAPASEEEIDKIKEQIFLNNPDQIHLEELIGDDYKTYEERT